MCVVYMELELASKAELRDCEAVLELLLGLCCKSGAPSAAVLSWCAPVAAAGMAAFSPASQPQARENP